MGRWLTLAAHVEPGPGLNVCSAESMLAKL